MDPAYVDNAGTVHACPVGAGYVAKGGYDPQRPSMQCGCRVLVHRFRCPGCARVVGWCMGCADEIADVCDTCWDDIRRTWRRLRAGRRQLLETLADAGVMTRGRREIPLEKTWPDGYRARTLAALQKDGLVEVRVGQACVGAWRPGDGAARTRRLVHVRLTARGRWTVALGRALQQEEHAA